jgi:hypothetical protein
MSYDLDQFIGDCRTSLERDAKARFVRVTGVDLEYIPRHRFDIATGVATRMESRTTR